MESSPTFKPVDVNPDNLLASICRDSYFEFLKEFWDEMVPERPVFNWHIEFLCEELQKVAERVIAGKPKEYDLVINISPGSTKSTAASVGFLPWLWTRMPTCRVINGSHTHELVLDLSRKSRDVLKSDKYQRMFPQIEMRADQDTKGYFANTRGGFRFSCTVGGKSPMGMHAHIHVVDDPIDPQKAVSDVEIKTANTWLGETLSTRKVDKAITPLILIMQRLHQNDPSGYRLSKGRVRHICIPAEVTDNISPPELRKKYVKGLMDPVRLSRQVLKDAYEDLGDYAYSGQYLQDPIPLGGGMFRTDRIVIADITKIPKIEEFKRIIRYWDKAGSVGKGAYTVGVKMGLDLHGRVWILDVIRERMEAFNREQLIFKTAHADGKLVRIGIEQEGGSGGKESAEMTVKRLLGFHVRVDVVRGDKALRADPFSVQVNAGNVWMKEAFWNKAYLEEMKYFPHSTYKDQIDASSGAFAMLERVKRRVGAL